MGERDDRQILIQKDIHKVSPVSIPKQSPNVSSTATTSLASMLSQAMDMMKARVPRRICMLQCGGVFTFRRKNNATEAIIPVKIKYY